MERIAFVIPDIGGGGAARVAAILCGEWRAAGHEVHLITFEAPGANHAYPIHADIILHQLDLGRSPRSLIGFLFNNSARIIALRRTFRKIKPTIVISFLLEANATSAIASIRLDTTVLLSERNHPEFHKLSLTRHIIRRWSYPLADLVCVQTADIANWFRTNLKIDPAVIANPVYLAQQSRFRGAVSRRRAIALGRLAPQKAYDRLIDAFAIISSRVPEWELVIFGEGEEREALQKKIEKVGLRERIMLPGVTQHTTVELSKADLFIHTARYEGFPNAIVEALAAGLCVAATDCPGATREILGDGRFGRLLPDGNSNEIAPLLLELMHSESIRARYSASSKEAIANLSPQMIARQWLSHAEQARRSRTKTREQWK